LAKRTVKQTKRRTGADSGDDTIVIVSMSAPSSRKGEADLSGPIKLSDYLYAQPVKTSDFRDRLNVFLDQLKEVVGAVPEFYGRYQMDEIEISAEVNASGHLRLLGSGGSAGAKGGIKFKFKRLVSEKVLPVEKQSK
jgi:hypothetical protein